MKQYLIFPHGHNVEIDIPIRFNKGDQVFPLNFLTKENILSSGITQEYIDDYECCCCYIDFCSMSTNSENKLIVQYYLSDFE